MLTVSKKTVKQMSIRQLKALIKILRDEILFRGKIR